MMSDLATVGGAQPIAAPATVKSLEQAPVRTQVSPAESTPKSPTEAQAQEASQMRGPSPAKVVSLRPPEPAPVDFDPKELRQRLQAAVDQLNEQARSNGRALAFSVDEAINRTVITVKSSQTGEVVRQIPGDVVLKIAHNFENMKGSLLDALA